MKMFVLKVNSLYVSDPQYGALLTKNKDNIAKFENFDDAKDHKTELQKIFPNISVWEEEGSIKNTEEPKQEVNGLKEKPKVILGVDYIED